MATLIPRKQIEEFQEFTGSLDIGGDLIVSQSLLVSQSFFLGNNTASKSEITSSLELTGSLTIDGEFVFLGETLTVTSSDALLAQDTVRFGGLTAPDFGANIPTLYVSSTDGDDNNDGRTIQFPLRTIKRACEIAERGDDGRYGLPSGSFSGYVVRVQGGTYFEDNPVIVPKNTTIWGSGLRITKVQARNVEQDLFWVNSGVYLSEMTFGGLRLYPDQIEPERGFAVAFQPGTFITTSPYIQNCSQISNQENSFLELYEEIPPGGGGLYVNGDVIAEDSPLASMVLDAYTQISPNGVGCLVNGRGFIQLVSFFTNFSYYAIRVNNGGHATLNNSNISFGLFGMFASGSRPIESITGGNEDARLSVRNSYSVIIDSLRFGLEEGLPSVTVLNTDGGIKTTEFTQSFSNNIATTVEVHKVSEDFKLISNIVKEGPGDYPTLLAKSSIKGYDINNPYNINGIPQVLTSTLASSDDLEQISGSFATILSIFEDGTGSFTFKSNNRDAIRIGSLQPTIPNESIPTDIVENVSSSFGTVIRVLSSGSIPPLSSSISESIKVTGFEPTTASITASADISTTVSSSFSIIYNILDNGTGSEFVDVPNNHTQSFDVTVDSGSTDWLMNGEEEPLITLFRGKEYRFNVSGSVGNQRNPFFIRTQPSSGFVTGSTYGNEGEINLDNFNYNDGVVNNGDDFGLIIFTVPFDAPNTLYYVSQNDEELSGIFQIVNDSTTPQELVPLTLTYPPLIQSGSISSSNATTQSVYQALLDNIGFIQSESIAYVSSSWADFDYNQDTCARDIGFIVSAVANDLIYGGNEGSINAGIEYYKVPSEATSIQKEPTLTAIKYVSQLADKLIKNQTFVTSSNIQDRVNVWNSIRENKSIVQSEVITFISSSWSNFDYNDVSCSRDVGYILDAVATDTLYGGNERAIEAGRFYFKYPSLANIDGDGDSLGQLNQTVDGIRFAAGFVDQILSQSFFQQPSTSTSSSYVSILDNKSLIQQETINFINATYPFLDYNQVSCSRDVGYIIDAIATDLRYGGNERAEMAGNFYYDYPSVATTTQKTETRAGIRYTQTLVESIVSNEILETPRLIDNSELGIKVGPLNNITSSISGSDEEATLISGSFNIVVDIIDKGTGSILSAIAKNRPDFNWSLTNPVNVSDFEQITSTSSLQNYTSSINTLFQRVANVVRDGLELQPELTKSIESGTKINDITQITSSLFVSSSVTSSISSSFGNVLDIIVNGTGSIPEIVPNSNSNILVTGIDIVTGSVATGSVSASISSSYGTIINILENGTGSLPTLVENTNSNIYFTTLPTTSSVDANSTNQQFVSGAFAIVLDILNNGTGSYTASSYGSPSSDSNTIAVYLNLKSNIGFIQSESIAYISSSWSTASYDEDKCIRDIGFIVSGAAEDLLYGVYSASVVNGQFYYEYPSQATGSQLGFTSDGINYARRLTQKVIVNTPFVTQSQIILNGADLLINNKELIQSESVAYVSSSWSQVNYDDTKCIRDVGYILDAVITDLKYGGNERTITAGVYYYLFPSQATGSQLFSTVDAVEWASQLSQKIVVGEEFTQADPSSLEASRVLRENGLLIGSEVVSYVSSSWSEVTYNQDSCSRDVQHIVDAARTDLVYGGNERASIAGRFYYDYPSAAIVGGVPSETRQKDPTVTGIEYGADLAQKIVLSEELTLVSNDLLNTYDVVYSNKELIKQNTIKYINTFFPFLFYNEASCSRDTGFILDGVLTDLVYGGNQRSRESARFYYLYPSLAIQEAQNTETFEGIIYAGSVTKLVSINQLIDDVVIGRNIDNTIKVGNIEQFISTQSGSVTEVLNVSSSFTLVTDIVESGVSSFTPTSASYNPANGEFVMTIPNHTLKVGNIIYLRDESFVFTCTMDGNRTEHALPSVGQPAYNSKLEIQSVTQNTITVNVGKSGPDVEFNPTDATYNPATGEFVVTVGEHDLSIGEGIVFATRSFAFTCDMDNNHSTKSYPRFGIDPFSVRSIPITAVTEDTLTFNVGASGPNKFFTPTDVDYDALTGEMVLTVGQHGLGIGRGVILVTGSIAFTCDQDDNQTTHSYPRSGSDPFAGKSIEIIDVGVSIHTVEDAPYNAETGITTLTITNHGFSNGDYIKISDNSLTYTCILDGNTIQKSYPRPGYDLPSGRWLEISNVTTNTFTIDIGSSSYVDSHTFITASANGLERQTGTFTINVGDAGSASGSIHTFVSASDNAVQHLPQSVHTFVSASAGALRHYPQAGHTFVRTTPNSVSTLPIVIENIDNTIKVTDITQFTSSLSALPQDIEFLSSSFGIVLDIVKNGSGSYEPTPYGTASTDVNTVAAYNLLRDNIPFIQGETIAYISSSWSDFEYNDLSCSRDIGFIVSGAVEDLLHGVDSASIVNGKFYFEFPSSATVSGSASPNEDAQLFPTLDGIRYAARLSDKIIQNIVFQTASLEVSASNVLIVENKQFIKEETISYLSSSWSDFDYNETTCKRDIGFILDAVRTDLVYGGNERSVNAGEFYYRFPSAAITGGIVSPTPDAQLFPTLDGIRYAGDVSQKLVGGSVFQTASLEVSASVDILRKNRSFIQQEVIEYVSSSWSQVVYNQESCSRDTGFILDASITDLLYGGEERSVNAGEYYFLFPSNATVAGVPSEQAQKDPTLTGIRYGGKLSSILIFNPTLNEPSASRIVGRDLLQDNKLFIQKETIAFLSSSWSTLDYNEISCSRDLGFILDAVSTDLIYGGNESSVQAGNYYYLIPSVAIQDSYSANTGQKQQTADGINFARGVSEKVIEQTQLVFAGEQRREAVARLLAAKEELQRRALAYTNGAFPDFIYNEASCSRDTGFIVDALATDLLYGGNERGIEAAESYFLGTYSSAEVVINEQRRETIETNRYLRTRAEFIAANAPKEDFGSLIVATGIDFSYNGSGVTFKALPPNQGGSGTPNPDFEITELGGGRIYFTSGNQDGDFRIGTGLTINQETGTLVGRTFSKSLFSLVTPFSLALEG